MFEKVKSLYRLDQVSGIGKGAGELSPLPLESKVLLISLVVVWIFIIGGFIYGKCKNKKKC